MRSSDWSSDVCSSDLGESRAVAGGRLLLHKTDGRVGRLQMIVQRCDALTHFFKGCDGCLRFGREHHALKRYTLLGAQRCHNDLAGTAPHAPETRRVQTHRYRTSVGWGTRGEGRVDL